MECPVDGCQEYLPSKRALGEHIRVDHHGKYSLVCKLCPIRRTYASMSNMQKHWSDHHADSVPQARASVNPRAVDSMDVDADDASMNDYGTCNDESDDVPTNADSANDDPGIRQFFSRQMGRGTARTSLDDVYALLERVLRIVESGTFDVETDASAEDQTTSSAAHLDGKSAKCYIKAKRICHTPKDPSYQINEALRKATVEGLLDSQRDMKTEILAKLDSGEILDECFGDLRIHFTRKVGIFLMKNCDIPANPITQETIAFFRHLMRSYENTDEFPFIGTNKSFLREYIHNRRRRLAKDGQISLRRYIKKNDGTLLDDMAAQKMICQDLQKAVDGSDMAKNMLARTREYRLALCSKGDPSAAFQEIRQLTSSELSLADFEYKCSVKVDVFLQRWSTIRDFLNAMLRKNSSEVEHEAVDAFIPITEEEASSCDYGCAGSLPQELRAKTANSGLSLHFNLLLGTRLCSRLEEAFGDALQATPHRDVWSEPDAVLGLRQWHGDSLWYFAGECDLGWSGCSLLLSSSIRQGSR